MNRFFDGDESTKTDPRVEAKKAYDKAMGKFYDGEESTETDPKSDPRSEA